LFFLIFILLLTNLPLFYGGNTDILAFYPALVKQGKWWLIFTSQFAHITWYHLLLDGIPFLLLYCTLYEKVPFKRLLYVFFAGIGSILASSFFSKDIAEHGLRGLSGITYGIMAVSSLEMITEKESDKTKKIIGTSILLLLLGLIAYELLTGKFPFEFLLFNMVGKPILVCHAGGVIGALVAFLVLRIPKLAIFEKDKNFLI
jgi:rhomboid family GlyGly-CTERM serine protease